MAALTMFKGETLVYTTQLKNADGSYKNLTGALVYFTVKNQYSEQDGSAVSQLHSPSNGVTITNANIGGISVSMPPTATYALPGDFPIDLIYDIKVIDVSGVQSIPESGTIAVSPAVTRAIS